jgi:alpha-galactosidase
MTKIAFIGAGSLEFTRELVRDILTFPLLEDSTLALMDIDAERLSWAKKDVDKFIAASGRPARVEASLDRRQALQGADVVLTTILTGSTEVWRHDIEIPRKYGVDLNVGDTRGPAGIFRFLRTVGPMLDIVRDMEECCPDAVLLNYTNPMAMLCAALQRQTSVPVTGLCHSVQGTAMMLADWIGASFDEIDYLCAGINHQAWYLEYKWRGADAYPLIHRAITERPEIYQEEIVRNEMFMHLGYYVTESSGHNSEYNWWFRKRSDLVDKYCTHGTGWNPVCTPTSSGSISTQPPGARWWKPVWQGPTAHDLERRPRVCCLHHQCPQGRRAVQINGNVRQHWPCDGPAGGRLRRSLLGSSWLPPMHVGALPPECALTRLKRHR